MLPYKYEKNKFPHQILRKSKEWKEKRAELIEKWRVCQWCGSKHNLQVSHNRDVTTNTYKYLFERLMYERNLQYADVFKNNYPDLLEEYEREVEKICADYIKTDRVKLLCRKCHYAYMHGAIKICPRCEEHYIKNSSYEYCYKCHKRDMKKK